MQTISLSAHFDGHQIVLDEPFALAANTPLMVTVLPKPASAASDNWQQLAMQNLALAYGDDEPAYSVAELKSPNPDYAGG